MNKQKKYEINVKRVFFQCGDYEANNHDGFMPSCESRTKLDRRFSVKNLLKQDH